MEKLTCKICGKVVEGYNKNHVNFLMMQHMLVHRKETTRDTLNPKNTLSGDNDQLNKQEVKK